MLSCGSLETKAATHMMCVRVAVVFSDWMTDSCRIQTKNNFQKDLMVTCSQIVTLA